MNLQASLQIHLELVLKDMHFLKTLIEMNFYIYIKHFTNKNLFAKISLF